jgi:hypothetical protein
VGEVSIGWIGSGGGASRKGLRVARGKGEKIKDAYAVAGVAAAWDVLGDLDVGPE